MIKEFLEDTMENINNFAKEIDNKLNISGTLENLKEKQNEFLESSLGKAINGGVDIALKVVLPDFIEDEVIAVKDSLVKDGFGAAVNTAIEEAVNIGKSLTGIVTGTFENIGQVKKAVDKGGLIDSVSELLNKGIDWAKENDYISKDTAKAIKNGKNEVVNILGKEVGKTLENQIESIEKIEKYIDKWQKYYNEQNFSNMDYQYKHMESLLKEVMPLENILKKAREVENLHELIKNNGKNFNLTEEQKELAGMLVN